MSCYRGIIRGKWTLTPNAFEIGSQMRAGIGKWLTYDNSERPHSTHSILPPDEAYESKTEQKRLAA